MYADLFSSPFAVTAVVAWFAVVGGAVGSFLNVVVYRMPAGMSILYPPSHCPACKRPIRWRDNLPVLGWVLLRGRCRDCRTRISIRYPVVEAITAALFLLVAWVEIDTGCANLPLRPWPVVDGVIYRPLDLGEVLGSAGFHLLLLTTLLAMALIEYDGQVVPVRIALPALVVGAVFPLLWPQLRPVPVARIGTDWIAGFADGIAGLGVGMAIGLAAWRLLDRSPGERERVGGSRQSQAPRRSLTLGPSCVGLFLGWQAGIAIGLFMLVSHFVLWGRLGGRWPWLARTSPGTWLTIVTLAWIIAWKSLSGGP